MKLLDLEKYLKKHGCIKKREGGNHTIWENKKNKKISTVPRHREIKDFLAQKVFKQLDIPSK